MNPALLEAARNRRTPPLGHGEWFDARTLAEPRGGVVPNRWNLPDLGLGIGLRPQHFQHILDHKPDVGFFEIISENFMDNQGRAMYILDQIAERYSIVMHGVCMSIGSTDPLDREYLARLRRLAERTHAPWISDHLCWTGVAGRNVHDLLPVPLCEVSLRHVVRRIRTVQEILERPLIVENPSSYLDFTASQMPEWEFIARMAEDADCGLLLDVNNVYVSAFNHDFDAATYIDAMPTDRIVYHHLAGHTHRGTHILDTHSDHVVDDVWSLYGRCHEKTGGRPTLLEWDENIPSFEVVLSEIRKAEDWRTPAREAGHGG